MAQPTNNQQKTNDSINFNGGDWCSLPFEYHQPEAAVFIPENKTLLTKLIDRVRGTINRVVHWFKDPIV